MNQKTAIRLGSPERSAAAIEMATLLGIARQKPPRSLEQAREGADMAAHLASVPDNISIDSLHLGGVRCEWLQRNDRIKTDPQCPVIVYAHGGGFVVWPPNRCFSAVQRPAGSGAFGYQENA